MSHEGSQGRWREGRKSAVLGPAGLFVLSSKVVSARVNPKSLIICLALKGRVGSTAADLFKNLPLLCKDEKVSVPSYMNSSA